MNFPRLIGLTGLAGCGKDTLADHLVKNYGYTKYALASPLKRLLNDRFGWTDEQWLSRAWKEAPQETAGAKYIPSERDYKIFSPRSWAQWLGTDVVRRLAPNAWVDLMEQKWEDMNDGAQLDSPCTCCDCKPRMVVPDVRFDNEAARIIELGGAVLLIERPGLGRISSHSSEDGVHGSLLAGTVDNSATIDKFLEESERILKLATQS